MNRLKRYYTSYKVVLSYWVFFVVTSACVMNKASNNQTPFKDAGSDPTEWKDPNCSSSICRVLQSEKVISQEKMKDYLHQQGKKCEFEGQVWLITFSNGMKAVFKSVNEDEEKDAYAEVVAYQVLFFVDFLMCHLQSFVKLMVKKGLVSFLLNLLLMR